jgi:tetratricopeptide (TPR) repeat protein
MPDWLPHSLRAWKGLAVVFALGAAATIGVRAQVVLPKTAFDGLYYHYADGDYGIVARIIRTGRDFRELQPPANDAQVKQWLGKWTRTKAAFILEVADAESTIAAGHFLTLISAGRLYVINRPTPLGQDPAEDAFELAWHQAAMALLEERLFSSAEDVYLDTLQRRYASSGPSPRPQLDPRFVLERGVAQEQRCWNSRDDPDPNPSEITNRQLSRAECLKEAIRRFAAAAAIPQTAVEANVRTAWMHFQLGGSTEALRVIEHAGAYAEALRVIEHADQTTDNDLTYWTQLFHGRILDALDRPADAERAFRSALETRPFAQSANVGLALMLYRLGRVTEARDVASLARQQPRDTADPWWTYLGADARFYPRWRAELRLRLAPQ